MPLLLVLNPKVIGANSFRSFRLISLCNYFYKIFAKFLTKRVIKLLPKIIVPQQSSFVPSRQILDSIIEVHKVIHSLEVGKYEGFLLKLNLYKAYDRVDWWFLDRILEAFGFNARVRMIILKLVSTPSFTVMVNETPF